MRLALVSAVLCVLALAPPAFADPLADGVAAIPGGVEDIRIGGTWDKGGKSGAYRIVITRSGGDAVVARLFIQWITYDDSGEATVLNSIEIKEFADLKADIIDYTSESDADGLSVYLETIDPTGKADESYELQVFSPTDYRFGPASN
jgi:hypothetical protein